jgi:ubiquinone/menaquinone biosynthesis C-methylase UbiE
MTIKNSLRAILRRFRRPVEIKRSWIETPDKLGDLTQFLSWFDKTSSVEETVERARSDWQYKITAFDRYAALPRARCLEIGFGGGRLLVEASNDFTDAIGVDIHTAFNKTRDYLALHHRTNIRLLHRDELNTIEDASVDFIYSFIVFQHFDTYEEVDFYLDHIRRILTPTGCAQIFFAKSETQGVRVIDPLEFKKRKCSLFINPALFRERIAQTFAVLDFQDTMKKHVDRPESKENESEQARVVFGLRT